MQLPVEDVLNNIELHNRAERYKSMLIKLRDIVEQYAESGCIEAYMAEDGLSDVLDQVEELLSGDNQ